MDLSDSGYTAGGYYFEDCNATSNYVEEWNSLATE